MEPNTCRHGMKIKGFCHLICRQVRKDHYTLQISPLAKRQLYVPMGKKKKAVVILSTMHAEPNVESNTFAKPDIITYYNKTKGGVDNMDKLLGEYSCKRCTSRWPLSIFFNAIYIAALASYIIYVYMEFNIQHKSTYRRRKFLKDLN